jgi:nitrogen PTS system EIIA component
VNLKQVLDPSTIVLNLAGTTKKAVIDELLDLLVRAGKLVQRADALRAVLEREAKMSTAIQNGVAIPHAKSDAVSSLVTAIGLKPQGVDFESLDGQPTRIFIMTLSPQTRVGPHIQFLSAISQSLDKQPVREALLRAQTPKDVIDILTAG